MSNKSGEPNRSHGSGAIIGRLAVGAILSAPVAAVAAVAGAGPATAAPAAADAASSSCPKPDVRAATAPTTDIAAAVAGIREQFQSAFTAGAVPPAQEDKAAIICDQ